MLLVCVGLVVTNVPHLILFSEVGGGWMHCQILSHKKILKKYLSYVTRWVSINSISDQGRTGAFVVPTRPTKKIDEADFKYHTSMLYECMFHTEYCHIYVV